MEACTGGRNVDSRSVHVATASVGPSWRAVKSRRLASITVLLYIVDEQRERERESRNGGWGGRAGLGRAGLGLQRGSAIDRTGASFQSLGFMSVGS